MLGRLCTESPEDVDVQALKAKYQTLLNEKPSWLNDAKERRENETEVINQVLTELNLEMGNTQADDSTGEGCNEVERNETTDVEYEKTIENDDGTRKYLMEEFENADVPDGSKVNAVFDADVHDDIESTDVGTNADEMEREESDKTVNKEVPDIRAVESCGEKDTQISGTKDFGTKVDEDKQEVATTDAEGETESLIMDKVVGTDVPVVSTDVPDKVVGTDVPVVGTKVVNETLVESAKVVGTDVPVIGATFHPLFEVNIESKGKQTDVQEKEQVEETLNAGRKQPFDSFNYDGPNWSVGLTQLEEIGSQNKTGIIHEEGAIVMSAEPLMVEPVTVFDESNIVENMGFFYKEEIERANKERMLAEMDARKRILPDREKGITYVNKSPFFRRGVDINEDTSKDDNRIWDYIRNDEGLMYVTPWLCGSVVNLV